MTKKYNHLQLTSRLAGVLVAAALISAGFSLSASAQQGNFPVPGPPGAAPTRTAAPALQLPALPATTPITPNGEVVEDVIVRVNDQIITRSEYERAQQQVLDEARQQSVSQADLEEKERDLLRDMIDQQLLLSKGKELGINGDTETMRQLDEIRKQNHLDSMEALQKAAEEQGVSFEDFKQKIRNQVITQQVVQDEVGRKLSLTHAQEEAYYQQHGKDFEVPEQVHLSEILIPTPENASDAQINAAQQKADEAEAKLKAGTTFADVAKTTSGGPTASAGGDLGDFKRGALGDVLEKATFSLPAGGVTQPIRTRQGFVILRVDNHQAAGIPPLADVERQVQEAIYFEQLQPALRTYLTKAREDAYIDIKPGFIDTGASRQQTKPVFTSYAPPPLKKKVVKKQRVEQEKAEKAQANLAAERQKLAAKQANLAAAKSGGKAPKKQKIHREKIRYGQAPQRALPADVAQTADVSAGTAMQGQTAGSAMSPTDSVTTISTGTGFEENNTDAFAPKAAPGKKTRFSSRENQTEETRTKEKLVRAETKVTTKPVAATPSETEEEKAHAAPLGLNGDTAKHKKQKQPKQKRVKGQPTERLQQKTKPVDNTPPVAPTANPALGGGNTGQAPANSSGQTPAPTNPPQQ
jgi:peptidyl-prolyl cis-trans isomerase SurA